MEIRYDVIYKKEIKEFSFDNVSRIDLIKLYRDGRISSRFFEYFLSVHFPELRKAPNGNSPYDLYNGDFLYEQKTLTNNGLKLTPSNQIGQGRKFNEEKFAERITQLSYYIIVNVIDFPYIEFVFVEAFKINKNVKNYNVDLAKKIFFSFDNFIYMN